MTAILTTLTTCPCCGRTGVGIYLVCSKCGRPVCGWCPVGIDLVKGEWQCDDGCTMTPEQTAKLRKGIAAQMKPVPKYQQRTREAVRR